MMMLVTKKMKQTSIKPFPKTWWHCLRRSCITRTTQRRRQFVIFVIWCVVFLWPTIWGSVIRDVARLQRARDTTVGVGWVRGGLSKGWAGNCGDGGIGSSTWYLVCKECRLRYQQAAKAARQASKKDFLINKFRLPKVPILTPISSFHTLIENSLFLLTLSNSTSYEAYTDLSQSSNLSPYSFFPTTTFKYLEFCSSPNKEDETPTKDVLDNIDTIKRRVHKNSGSSSEGKDLNISNANQNNDSFKENSKDMDKNKGGNNLVNSTNPKARPTSVYFNYKFNPGNGSSTFVNLTEKVKDTSHCWWLQGLHSCSPQDLFLVQK